MHLLTDDDRAALPGLYATEGQGEAAVCRVRLYVPGTYWEWYAVEYDPAEELCFGLVAGHDVEAGYFSLRELGAGAVPVRRDAAFRPATVGEVRARLDDTRAPDGWEPHVIDYTDREPGDADPAGGPAFDRCPVCGRVGRAVVFTTGGRTFVHTMTETAAGGYRPTDRCHLSG